MISEATEIKVVNLPGCKAEIKEIANSRPDARHNHSWQKLGQYVIMFHSAMGCNQFDNDKDGA